MSSLEIAVPQQEVAETGVSTWRDWLGIVASVGCAIHCAAMPFVIAYLPALGLSFLADESFHKWMALVCFLIAIVAFIPGIFKHGSWVPVSIASVGLVCITFAAFGLAGECCASCSEAQATIASNDDTEQSSCCDDDCEHCQAEEAAVTVSQGGDDVQNEASFLTQFAPWITPIGGVLLVAAHLLNRRYGWACSCCATQSAESTSIDGSAAPQAV